MRLLALLAAGLFAGGLMAAPVPKAEKDARPSLDGTWRMVEQDKNGKKEVLDVDLTWTVKGEELVVRKDGQVQLAPRWAGYELKAPKGGPADALDHVVHWDTGHSQTLPGVFKVDGDTLTYCLALKGDRPAECKPGPDCTVYTFKRVKDEKKEEPKKDK